MLRPILLAALAASGAHAQDTPAARGEALYNRTCIACHSPDTDRVGPRHRDVVGRRIASIAGYDYTPALRRLRGNWTPARLDAWLANPQALARGTTMTFYLEGAGDRADMIAYLATLGAHPGR